MPDKMKIEIQVDTVVINTLQSIVRCHNTLSFRRLSLFDDGLLSVPYNGK